jgi:hypothetical protein
MPDPAPQTLVIVIPLPGPTPPAHEARSPEETMRLAAQVYAGLSPDDVTEIERIALDRGHFFAGREWACRSGAFFHYAMIHR